MLDGHRLLRWLFFSSASCALLVLLLAGAPGPSLAYFGGNAAGSDSAAGDRVALRRFAREEASPGPPLAAPGSVAFGSRCASPARKRRCASWEVKRRW
ncbi:Hypothetical predicted protein, partial [Podarcis lilfordi]